MFIHGTNDSYLFIHLIFISIRPGSDTVAVQFYTWVKPKFGIYTQYMFPQYVIKTLGGGIDLMTQSLLMWDIKNG